MEVKVVVGSSFGDEGKGLVSGCLAREAWSKNQRILTVFYNGTSQRAHTFNGVIHRFTAAGDLYGSDTFYHHMFVVDPIALWLSNSTPTIDPRCRVIFPCDVLYGQAREKKLKHGSCGCGLFAAVKRSKEQPFHIGDMFLSNDLLYKRIQDIDSYYQYTPNELHNLPNFVRAMNWLKENCRVTLFEDIVKDYDTIIFEGGQGLLLDQANKDAFPHLTPSSTGAYNIHTDIETLGAPVDLFYVSRSYLTRHGEGPMDECAKEQINPSIIDTTNEPNEWQGTLRFGLLDIKKLYRRIQGDAAKYNCATNINVVYTHLNYTGGALATTEGIRDVVKPQFVDRIWGSDVKDHMEIINDR